MSPRFLLDTNICIYVRKKRPHDLYVKFQRLSAGYAGISIITHGESVYGAHKSVHREDVLRKLREFCELVPVLGLP